MKIKSLYVKSITSSYICGHFGTIMLKYGQGVDTWIFDPDAVLIGGYAFIVASVINSVSYTIASVEKTGNKRLSVPQYFPSTFGINSLLSKLGMVKLNGNNTFLYSTPNVNLTSLGVDTVYFSSHSTEGLPIQIPSEILWKFLRYAEKNRAKGRGLSGRFWANECSFDWWHSTYYHPIIELLLSAERHSMQWIPPSGIQIISRSSNQWLKLMPNASTTMRLCAISQFGDKARTM